MLNKQAARMRVPWSRMGRCPATLSGINMSRRKQSLLDGLIDASRKLPWWLGVMFALAAYVGLQSISGSVESAGGLFGMEGDRLDQPLFQALIEHGKLVLPAVFLLLAAISAYGRITRGGSSDPVTAGPRRGALNSMSWQQFETLVAEGFRRKGYSVTEKGGGPNGSIDLALKKGGEVFLVQFKQWRAIKVGVNTVRELEEAMSARHATGGFVVTSGMFTDGARAFAKDKHINLMDGKALHALLRGVTVPSRIFRDPLSILTRGAPFCPECQGRMAKKRARKGVNAGKIMWRCLRYPDCKGSRPA